MISTVIGIKQHAVGERKGWGGWKYGLLLGSWYKITVVKMFTGRERDFLER